MAERSAQSPTIRDVAARAGVSIATVSRVLNAKGRYTPKTEANVMGAAADLGYSTNLLARGLKTGLSRTVGIVIGEYVLVNHPVLLLSAAELFRRQGFDVQLFPNLALADCVRLLAEGRIDGLLFTESERDDLAMKTLVGTRKPLVFLGGDIEREDVNLVEIDYFQGGYIATRHLLNLGHRDILLVSPHERLPHTQEITRGYLFALDERGVQYSEELILRTRGGGFPAGERAGYDAILAASGSESAGRGFSAVLATDDRIACGALKALLDGGRRVPEDVSVVGFGDFGGSEFMPLPLTTVDTPVSQMGELGAEILANGIDRGDNVVKRVKLKVNLVKRATTAARRR